MTTIILRKEFKEYFRDRRFLALGALMAVLLVAASVDGWNRSQADDAARSSATDVDRHVWEEQGENNPHGAAHFSRYAFRHTPPLAAFDPGVFDYAGAAFWMEAHTQNPTTLRRAEDAAVQAPFPSLSPAWIIQVVGSLILAVLMFQAVAGERQRGTLRALSGVGVRSRDLALGKSGAVLALTVGITVIALLLAIAPGLVNGTAETVVPRVLVLALVHAVGLAAFAFLILSLSARSARLSRAFTSAATTWLFLALVWPALAGQLANSLDPDVDEQEFKEAIQARAKTPFYAGDAKEPAVAALEARVVAAHGGNSWEELGFNRQALELQAHEEFANAVYDSLYGELYGTHARQDATLRYASLLSPVLAMQRISSGVAGTDLLAQLRFADQSEQHRRKIIEQLNDDMMLQAGEQGFQYMAGRSLWESIPAFEPSPPTLTEVFQYYGLEILALLGWLVVCAVLAVRGTHAAVHAEVG